MSDRLMLSDITVIELGHSVAAPYACQILGDLGADIIKVEKSDGDDARKWAPPYWGGMSAIFQSLNRNKRSIVIDLRDPAANRRLKQLIIDRADVVVQNLRPGSAAALGLDAKTLCALKPSLIYSTIGAFGAIGPLKDKPGYDPLMQAFAGLMSVTGEPNSRPVRVGTSIIDMAAGMWSVIGIVSALVQRASHGRGAVIETSLYETALAWMATHAATFQASGEIPQRQGTGVGQIVPYRGYVTKDGFMVVGAGNDKLFELFAGVLGHPEWKDDPRFQTNPDRVKHQSVLYEMIEAVMATRSNAEWQVALDAAGLPSAPMQSIDQVLAHEQTRALEIVQKSPDGAISLVGLPLSFDGQRPPFRLSPPDIGADTEQVLGNLDAMNLKSSRV
jgi:crotonobetainyl-CoA:carnitine CoA-transferase CaiB-like acyl-CoA transferase